MTDLPERLRNAADAHRPDRERMLARVEHAMAADGSGAHDRGARDHDRPPAAPWMRVTAVTAAVAGAIGIGGLAVGAVTGDGRPAGTVVTSGGSSNPESPHATASGPSGGAGTRVPVPRHSTAVSGHRGGTSTPRSPAGRTPPAAPSTQSPPTHAPATPPGTPVQSGGPQPSQSSGPLQSDGSIAASSNDYWTQSDVVLTTSQTLTSLTVELRIAVTNGETSTGSWSSVPDRTAAQVSVEGATLVYRWTLNAGQTLGPGSYTFSGQFNHDQGQGSTDGDHYTVTAGYGSGATATVSGGF